MNVKENFIKNIYLLNNFNGLWSPKDFYGRTMDFFFAMNTPFFAPFMKCFIDSIFLMKL